MRDFNGLAAIVLAAGASNRLPNENKLLKEIDGKPLLHHTLDCLSELPSLQTIVVTRPNALRDAINAYPSTLITNPYADHGMASSIKTGLNALETTKRGFFIVLADMPYIKPEDYVALAETFLEAPEHTICVPTFQDRRGHPVLFSRDYLECFKSLTGDQGAKPVLKEFHQNVKEVPRPSPRIFQDFDTLADFSSAQTEPKKM